MPICLDEAIHGRRSRAGMLPCVVIDHVAVQPRVEVVKGCDLANVKRGKEAAPHSTEVPFYFPLAGTVTHGGMDLNDAELLQDTGKLPVLVWRSVIHAIPNSE